MRVKALRERQSITQEEFGQALGLDQSAVSRIEAGQRAMTARELAAASAALNVTIGHLMEQEEAEPALLRAAESEDEAIKESLRIFSACIDEYRGIEALAG
ncbi:MAG TPA: helix-turn-helix transcriptional regulator [Solirubrobacterales bacterium]|nr:helix-turn-helix transcriptional regulator [Solirubrobacterales bacterium]